MGKIKYNVKGVDTKGDRPLPKPAVYRCKIVSCVDAKPTGKDRRLEVQYEITHGEHKGFKLYDYINLESEDAAWKLAQFVEAIGLPPSGTLDPDKVVGTALSVRTRIDPGNEQYAPQAKPATLIALDGDDADDDDEDLDDDDDGDEDADDDESGDEDDDDDDDDDDEDEDDEDEEDWTEEELEELSSKELKSVAEEFELEVPSKLTAKAKKKLIADILEAQEEDEDEDDEDEDEPDYESMDLADLKKLAKERKLATKGSKKVLIARLQKDDNPF